MKPREPYVRKHVHRWKIAKRIEAVQAGWDYWNNRPVEAEPLQLVRECDDCGLTQQVLVPDQSVLTPGYEAIADLPWKDEV